MIKSFRCRDTAALFLTGTSRRFGSVATVARRKLDMLDFAKELYDLRVPPGNRLESLSGSLKGRYSIRVNDQFRILFVWDAGALDVEIVDYH